MIEKVKGVEKERGDKRRRSKGDRGKRTISSPIEG